MNFTLYMHKNKINGKVYIGQTINIKKRWAPSSYKNSKNFYQAIKNYGWNNFEHIILQVVDSQEKANELEQYYIKIYHATDRQYGYNIADGGAHRMAMFHENNPFYGKHHSKESLELMKAKKKGGNNPNAKQVICLNTQTIYPSCQEASEWCKISRQNISRCCTGGRPTAGKYPITKEKLKWRYLEDEI